MKETFSLDTIYKVWNDSEGVGLTVGPDRDVGTYVEVYTNTKEDEEHFGKVSLVLPPKMAIFLGHALLKAGSAAADDEQKNSYAKQGLG